MISRSACALPAAALLAFGLPHGSAGAEPDTGLAGSSFIVGLGAGAGFAPTYEGSKRYEFVPVPALSLSWNDTLVIDNTTARVTVIRTPWLTAGPLAAWRPGRQQDDDHRLKGLGDVDDAFDLGGFARIGFGGWSASVAARQDVIDSGGALVDFNTGYGLPLSDAFTLSIGADATWASDDYMAANFGVTRQQARRSKYSAFDAEAGLKNAGLSLGATYALSERWSLNAVTGYERLLGDAARSPIVKDGGTADQAYGFVSVTYRFGL